jgi:hypothetical protein
MEHPRQLARSRDAQNLADVAAGFIRRCASSARLGPLKTTCSFPTLVRSGEGTPRRGTIYDWSVQRALPRLRGESRDPFRLWAPALAGVTEILMRTLVGFAGHQLSQGKQTGGEDIWQKRRRVTGPRFRTTTSRNGQKARPSRSRLSRGRPALLAG